MQDFRKLLVGIDVSGATEPKPGSLTAPNQNAVERSVWLAEQSRAEVTFICTLDKKAGEEEQRFAEQLLKQLVQHAADNEVTANIKVAQGTPWEEITREYVDGEHDLVIVGTREASRASRFLFGSTGVKLLRYCPGPVWVTKPGTDWNNLEFLVASDFSEVSQNGLEIAIKTAQLTGAKVRLVHALDNSLNWRMTHSGMKGDELERRCEADRDEAKRELQAQLDQTDWRTLEQGVLIEVINGTPETVVLDLLDEHNIDLLIMGTAARTGLRGMLVGNTAERLLPSVSCSILALKPADAPNPLGDH